MTDALQTEARIKLSLEQIPTPNGRLGVEQSLNPFTPMRMRRNPLRDYERSY